MKKFSTMGAVGLDQEKRYGKKEWGENDDKLPKIPIYMGGPLNP